MREKRFARGCIIIFFTVGIIALLFANYTTRLTGVLRDEAAQCEKNDNKCFNDLKKEILYSKEAMVTMVYTGVLTLITLTVCIYSFERFCRNKEEENTVPDKKYNENIKKAVKKINKKWKRKN